MAATFNISGATIVEGESTSLVFTISLSEPLTLSQILKYSTVNATATSGQDYTAASNLTVTFNPGETVKTISIPILNDNINETDETFLVNVFIPKGTPLNSSTTDNLVTTGIGKITDTKVADTTTTLAANIENLALTGTANVNGIGNGGNNVLTGNSGNNTLEGLAGNDNLDAKAGTDTLKGGVGDDIYTIDSTDTVVEDLNAGIDTVRTNFDYSLSTSTSNVENLILLGTENLTGTGNSSNNSLIGNSGNNTLDGQAGNDILDGKAGADTLKGGVGDDVYVIDNVGDTVIEDTDPSSDTIQANFTYSLANLTNVENLTLLGTSQIDGTGNSSDNTLIGNSNSNTLTGGAGNDVLDGGAGIDTLIGGAGDDRYVLDNPSDNPIESDSSGNDTGGRDTIETDFSYTLKDRFETLVLTGTGKIEGIGNGVANTITGNSSDNLLDGGLGNDTLAGGTGNDTYIIDNVADRVTEYGGQGIDTVVSSINYERSLDSNVENLTLTGSATTGAGNTINNILIGNNLNNSLSGDSGNDTLDGGVGADNLSGGTNNDTYIVDNTGDVVTEGSTLLNEIDLVQASVSYTLTNNVEELTLTGITNINGTGNILNNKIIGNVGNNTLRGNVGNDSLYGGDGDDWLLDDSANGGDDLLDGGAGKDYLKGGVGNDTYVVNNFRDQVVETWSNGTDSGGNDTVKSSITYALGINVENLTLTDLASNGTGNSLNNSVVGNNIANTLDGKDGNDYLDGGGGKDLILGGLGNDTLDGSTGDIDTLYGGLGNDTYLVGLPEDIIVEAANEGLDTVHSAATSYTISDNVENLVLYQGNISGTGNDLDNNISVDSSLTTQYANIINGGAGNDTMSGRLGNDVYYVDSTGDIIIESAGTDTGFDTVHASVSYTLTDNVEKLVLTGFDALNGTGNAGNNVLIGNTSNNTLEGLTGNDYLDGGLGSDTMKGGDGDDSYVVDNAGDAVSENTNAGLDLVFSSINYSLTTNVENLTLTGNADINGTGNSLDNIISGNDGANKLAGGTGNDTLLGSAGNDTLVGQGANDTLVGGTGADRFDYNTGAAFSTFDIGVDIISDFKSSELDKIVLGKMTFGLTSNVGSGFSSTEEFASVGTDAAAKSSTAKIVYSLETGNLFYNPDLGVLGGESAVAQFSGKPTLSASDFIIA
ncbi:Calx-beta domain-containing protein [Chroococcidiopsis sp.]|uniref:Calx-beta domain-containing protein n=1 Tax=Chroococcidiopsis sp. TaxID=3088168 RepID=UPI003F3CD191